MRSTQSAAEAVLTLRQSQHDRAEQRFAERLLTEAAARSMHATAEAAITEQYGAASALDGDDGVVEAFARWLPVARARAAQAAAAHQEAAAQTALARVALTTAAIALEAAQSYAAAAASERRAARRIADQAALDEQAGLRHGRA